MLSLVQPMHDYSVDTILGDGSQMTLEDLQAVISRGRPSFVYQFGCGKGTGFCADMTWMMTQLVKCLQFGIGFSLGKVTRPTNFCIAKGWDDYFLPFCEEVSAPGLQRLNRRTIGYSRRVAPLRPLIRAWLRATTNPTAHYFMFDELGDLAYLSPPAFKEHQPFLSACGELLSVIYRFTPAVQEHINFKLNSLPSQDYVAIHIRRGDKQVESPYVPLERYLQALYQLKDELVNVFVCSDDQRVVNALAAGADPRRGYRFFAMPSATTRLSLGYDHSILTTLSSQTRYDHTVRFLAELQMCANAKAFIGSSTSNVGTFVSMLRSGSCVTLLAA